MSTRVMSRYRTPPGVLQSQRIEKAAPHSTHSPGWPHLDRHGNCLCDLRCCIGPAGCRCEVCGCESHTWEVTVA